MTIAELLKQEGYEEGRKEVRKEVAEKMLLHGYDHDAIVELLEFNNAERQQFGLANG